MDLSHTLPGPGAATDAPAEGGQENKPVTDELDWMKRHEKPEPVTLPKGNTGHRVERMTALRNRGVAPEHKSRRAIRSRTGRDLLASDSDIPYAALEDSLKSLICALIERQDRVSEQFLLMINDIQYRLDDLELAANGRGNGCRPESTEEAP